MPIQFRCTSCNQKLAISRRKAGRRVTCPACAADLHVPTLEEAEAAGLVVPTAPEPSADTGPPPVAEPTAEEQLFDDLPPDVFDDLDDLDETSPDEPQSQSAGDEIAPATPAASAVAAPDQTPDADLVAAAPPSTVVTDTGPRRWSEEEDEEEDDFHLARSPMDEGGLDMTPMVDVTFLLLIFFMITASFSIQKSMEAEAPEPDQEGAAQMPSMDDLADDSVIVEIDENDVIYVDDAQVASIGELIEQLELKIASEQKREMIIEPHPQAKHGTVVQATDAGIEVGMQRIRRVTRKGE